MIISSQWLFFTLTELNIKIESALRGNEGDVFIDQTMLYDMLNTYDQNKVVSVPARKRRRVVA